MKYIPLRQTYLEAVRTVESLQHLSEGEGSLQLATGWSQLLAGLVELLLLLPLGRLLVTDGGEVPQVTRHDLVSPRIGSQSELHQKDPINHLINFDYSVLTPTGAPVQQGAAVVSKNSFVVFQSGCVSIQVLHPSKYALKGG